MDVIIPPIYQPLFTVSKYKIYEWNLSITNGTIPNSFVIETEYGEIDGKKMFYKNNILEGKGGRTPLEQAVLEANRKWKNKHEKELYQTDCPILTISSNNIIFVN